VSSLPVFVIADYQKTVRDVKDFTEKNVVREANLPFVIAAILSNMLSIEGIILY
jgi:hypothetical protein